jgi:type IV secretion system protein VirB10
MSFSRVIFPSGKEVSLQGMNGTGPRGSSGVNGNVHTHFWTGLGSALLVALITDGVDSIPNPNNSTTGNTYRGGGSSPTQAGAQVLQQQAQNLLSPYTNIQPTITLPPATPLRIMVNKTILLPTG